MLPVFVIVFVRREKQGDGVDSDISSSAGIKSHRIICPRPDLLDLTGLERDTSDLVRQTLQADHRIRALHLGWQLSTSSRFGKERL